MALSREQLIVVSASTGAYDVARRRRFLIPPELSEISAVVTKLDELRAPVEADPLELPSSADLVAKIVENAADRRARASIARQVATELHVVASLRESEAVASAINGWSGPLCAAFDEQLEAFRAALKEAPKVAVKEPHDLDGETFAAWSTATTLAINMTTLVDDRAAFGRVGHEGYATHWGGRLPLFAVFTPPSDEPDLVAKGFSDRAVLNDMLKVADPLEFWRAFVVLEARGWLRLALAPVDAYTTRFQLIEAWPTAFWALHDVKTFAETVSAAQSAWDEVAQVDPVSVTPARNARQSSTKRLEVANVN